MIIISTCVGVLVLIMFLFFFFSFYLGLSPVDVARGRKVQTVLRGVLIYFDTVCDKNLPYKTTCNFFLYGLLFERALSFVKFFSYFFSSGLSVFVHLMVSYLYVFMNFSFIQSAPW